MENVREISSAIQIIATSRRVPPGLRPPMRVSDPQRTTPVLSPLLDKTGSCASVLLHQHTATEVYDWLSTIDRPCSVTGDDRDDHLARMRAVSGEAPARALPLHPEQCLRFSTRPSPVAPTVCYGDRGICLPSRTGASVTTFAISEAARLSRLAARFANAVLSSIAFS